MILETLAQSARDIANRSSRNEKLEILRELLSQVKGREQAVLISLLSGALPQGKIGVGPAAVGKLARACPPPEPSSTLTLLELEEQLSGVSALSGKGSVAGRQAALEALLGRCGPEGQSFLLDLWGGGLRIGALAGVVEAAIAREAGVHPDSLRRAVTLSGSLAQAGWVAVSRGEEGLSAFKMELFRPLSPMLASPSDDAASALEKWSPAFFELKLDGARIQVHREENAVKVFSRTLRDVTASVPEVVEAVRRLRGRRLILDGEVLSLAENGRPRPFQETMRRFGRAAPDERIRKEVPLSPYFFDLLLHDEREFLLAPFAARREALEDLLPPSCLVRGGYFEEAVSAREFFEQAVSDGFEGVMAKNPRGTYQAGKRGADWLKLKPTHTLDLVVIAAEWGSGRRKGWLSNLHLAAPDQNGNLVMLGKTFKGLTDEILAWQTEQLLAREVGRERGVVYVRPELVVEIAFNDLQISPQYPGGLALRFARVRRYRPDKTLSEADSFETVLALQKG